VGRITPTGAITEFPVAGAPLGDITTGSDGNLYFPEYAGVIGQMNRDGVLLASFPVNASHVSSGSDGNVWFVEANNIGRLNLCHYFSGTVSPSTSRPGGTATVSGTLRNCATSSQALTFTGTATFMAEPPGNCASAFAAGSLAVTLPAGFSQSASLPFYIPADDCIGTYTISVSTFVAGTVIASETTTVALTVQGP
jgi:hypothetical protein